MQNREIGHLCYMKPLIDELVQSDNVLFVFYDFETTQDKIFRYGNSALTKFGLPTAILFAV